MGRPLRVIHANRLAHIMFHTLDDHWFTRKDLRVMRDKLIQLVVRHKLKIIYWVFMNNHVHLLMEFSEDDDSALQIGVIAKCLTDRYNQSRGRKGSLWRGRYKDVTVETETQLFNVLVYLALNKFKAGVVQNLDDDYYSSYLAYARGIDDEITTLSEDFRLWGRDIVECRYEFRKIVREAGLAWKNKHTWERIERGEEVTVAGGKVDMAQLLSMDHRQEKILAKAHIKADPQKSKSNLSKKLDELKRKALLKVERKKEKLAESLAAHGIRPWVLKKFWASEGFISDFCWAYPDRFGLRPVPS